jgi:hypothetical protein
MNVFQLDFTARLKAWRDLRLHLVDQTLEEQCVQTDNFWQQSPMSNFYLHPHDMTAWPDPWQLLDDNLYCSYARALGQVYTLRLLGITDVDMVDAIDYNNTNVVLVLVGRAKYILNYWPNTVLNNKLENFTVVRHYDITPIIQKIGTI